MKKKYIPAVITLTAGLLDCLLSIGKGMTNTEYVRQLLIVLVVFFILGLVVRTLVEKGLGVLSDKKEEVSKETNDKEIKENVEMSEKETEEE